MSMPTTTGRKMLVVASAITTGVLGLLATPIAAQAAPTCELPGFAGKVTITGDGAIIRLEFSANGTSATGGRATAMTDKGGALTGTIGGGIIENGPGIHLTFTPDGATGGSFVLTGEVRPDLIAVGKQVGGSWSTEGPLACLKESGPQPGVMFQLTGDVDMYDQPDGKGNKLPGFAEGGEGAPLVKLLECKPSNWCNIVTPDNKSVWVWGDFVPPEARF